MVILLTLAYLLSFGQDSIPTEALTYKHHALTSATLVTAHHQFFTLTTTAGIVSVAPSYTQPIPNYRSAPLPEVSAHLRSDSGYTWSHQKDASQHPP